MGRRGCSDSIRDDSCHGWIWSHESIPVHAILFDNPSAAATTAWRRCFDSVWSQLGTPDAGCWTWTWCADVYALSHAEFAGWTFADAKLVEWADEDTEYDGWAGCDEERERGECQSWACWGALASVAVPGFGACHADGASAAAQGCEKG